jgi:hypothetical protein
MAYFSNGIEGEEWEAQWCASCIHDRPPEEDCCPILYLHAGCNGDDQYQWLLDALIPMVDGRAGQCSMWAPKRNPEATGRVVTYNDRDAWIKAQGRMPEQG